MAKGKLPGWLILLLLVLSPVPGGAEPTPAINNADPLSHWMVEYRRSGGFVGTFLRVTLADDGSVVKKDVRREVSWHATSQQMATAKKVLKQLKQSGIPSSAPPHYDPGVPVRGTEAPVTAIIITLEGRQYDADPFDKALSELTALMSALGKGPPRSGD